MEPKNHTIEKDNDLPSASIFGFQNLNFPGCNRQVLCLVGAWCFFNWVIVLFNWVIFRFQPLILQGVLNPFKNTNKPSHPGSPSIDGNLY